MDITANFNDIVNDYVARNNISYNRFSELSGISSTNLYVILQSDSCPGLPTFIKAADFLTCSVDYLMGLSENPNYTPAEKPAAFYERLEKLLEENDLSKNRLAAALGIGSSAVSKWKKGKLPKPETLIAICNLFSCSADYLLGRSDSL